MKKTIIKLVAGFIFFGLALGLTFMLGDTLFNPIKEVLWFDGDVRTSVAEVIGQKILQVVGIFTVWTAMYLVNRVVVKDLTT